MKQLIRFCIVGCANFGISYSVFFLSYRYWPFSVLLTALPDGGAGHVAAALQQFGIASIDAACANVTGFAAGMANSFIWNKLWTFKAPAETRTQARRFIVVNLACLLFSTGSVFVFTDLNKLPYNLVWIVTMAFVTIMNFVASKYWVFKVKEEPHPLPS